MAPAAAGCAPAWQHYAPLGSPPLAHPQVDPDEKVMTAMTRDGLFLVENGAVHNFRFNQSLIEMLKNVELLGPAVRATGEEAFEMVVPAMKVRNFHFSEVTKF